MANAALSQDIIVTNNADSINCKITSIKPDYIYFTYNHKGDVRNTLLSTSNVTYYKFNYYQKSEIPAESLPLYNKNTNQIRFALNGGYMYRTAKAADNTDAILKEYISNLKKGYCIGAEFNYFFNDFFALGLLYSYSNSNGSLYHILYGPMSDNQTIHYIGPSYTMRIYDKNKKNAFYSSLSLGYTLFINKTSYIMKPDMLSSYYYIFDGVHSGSSAGVYLSLGYDFALTDGLSLGLQAAMVSGTITKLTIEDKANTETLNLNSDEYINLGRFELTVGLRFVK